LAAASAGSSIAAKMAMMAMTTSSSIKVKALLRFIQNSRRSANAFVTGKFRSGRKSFTGHAEKIPSCARRCLQAILSCSLPVQRPFGLLG
jgi:hypothetical protein